MQYAAARLTDGLRRPAFGEFSRLGSGAKAFDGRRCRKLRLGRQRVFSGGQRPTAKVAKWGSVFFDLVVVGLDDILGEFGEGVGWVGCGSWLKQHNMETIFPPDFRLAGAELSAILAAPRAVSARMVKLPAHETSLQMGVLRSRGTGQWCRVSVSDSRLAGGRSLSRGASGKKT